MRNMKKLLRAAELAVGTGLFLLDRSERMGPRMRDKLADSLSDLRDRAKVVYDTASDRLSSASKSLQRRQNHSAARSVAKFAVGLGVGVGVGLLIAPAKGTHTRNKLAAKAHEFGDNVRDRVHFRDLRPTGTDA